MTFWKDKWSLRRIDERYGSFVTMSVSAWYAEYSSPVIGANLPWLFLRRKFMTIEFFW